MIEVIRYYMGRIRGIIVMKSGKKALFRYFESGRVGNKDVGYKEVKPGQRDIIPMRLLRFKRKENES